MTTEDEAPIGPTHICLDGTLQPGKGKFDRSKDKCKKCYNAYLRERRDARNAKKWEKGGVQQIKMWRGHDGEFSARHGFYRKNLTPEETKLAERMHRDIKAAYDGLDDQVDDMVLYLGISNFVKALRKAPDRPNDKNVQEMQSFYERQFREAMDMLALSRRQRKEEGKHDNVREAMKALFPKKAVGFVVDATPDKDHDKTGAPQPAP